MRRLSLRDHLDEVIGDADLREHAEREAAMPPEPAAGSIAADPAAVAGGAPFAASLTGTVTPLSEARHPEARHSEACHPGPQLPLVPAPIESTIGRSTQIFTHAKPTGADNAPAMVTDAAGGPLPGEEHPAPHLARRRRRSASPLPPLPSPIDIPEDAPGRVTFVALAAAPDVVPPAAAVAEDVSHQPAPARPAFASPLDDWLSVIVLGVAMLLVFIVGVVVTH